MLYVGCEVVAKLVFAEKLIDKAIAIEMITATISETFADFTISILFDFVFSIVVKF